MPRSEFLHKLKVSFIVFVPFFGLLGAMIHAWQTTLFWGDIVTMITFYILTCLGITVGYHRMLTHQGFEAKAWVKAFWLILGTMSLQGTPHEWCATHVRHHAHSDEEGDPHSPIAGFWHAHCGWLFNPKNFASETDSLYLMKDPVVRWVNRWSPLWFTLSLLIPFAIGGLSGLLWGGFARIFLQTHVTWAVNSVCHTFGGRMFETTDKSRNQWLVGILACGEGWHNNHHAFPRNAYHGMRWWQIDFSGWLIRMMEKLGFVWNVHQVTVEAEFVHHDRTKKMITAAEDLRAALWTKLQVAKIDFRTMMDRPVHFENKRLKKEIKKMRAAYLKRMRMMEVYLKEVSAIKKRKLEAYGEELDMMLMHLREKMPMATA